MSTKLRLPEASSRYGASMGRADELPPNRFEAIKLRLERLKWVDGDYDQFGAYWGNGGGDHIFCAHGVDSQDDNVRLFIRARDRELARHEVLSELPNAIIRATSGYGKAIHIVDCFELSQLPRECIDQLAGSGQQDSNAKYWRDRLQFTVDRDNATRYIKSSGAWTSEELAEMEDSDIAEIILWMACSDFHGHREWMEENPNADPCDSPSGTDLIDISSY